MNAVEAIYSSGVFKPLGQVSLAENQRVRLIIEPAGLSPSSEWLDAAQEFQRCLRAAHGVLPDSTNEIAADRRRHE
jgi:predicted DNA-binding antitoxin AbrB/MazE fold protein